jgi:RNA polymerase sigma-70 factor, ECF subfamily
MVDNLSERVLIAQCKAGDHTAFTELLQRNSSVAIRAIRSIALNPADVDDIMQETFLQAYRHVNGFNERSKFSTWLTRIAINNALMLLRRQKRQMEVALDADPDDSENKVIQLRDERPNPEQFAIQSQSIAKIREAVSALPAEFGIYVRRRFLEELPHREVVKSLGITLAAGKSRCMRARGKLESRLAGHFVGPV